MDWRNDNKKVDVTVKVTGKQLGLFENYFLFGAPCEFHSTTTSGHSSLDCPNCKKHEEEQIKEMQKVTTALWREYLKQTKKPAKLNENQVIILEVVKQEMNTGLDMIPKEDIQFLAGKRGFNKKTTLELLESLEKSGDLYKPRKDFYKPTKAKKVIK
jgi:hypothetical protein